jgi:hypothetical protein
MKYSSFHVRHGTSNGHIPSVSTRAASTRLLRSLSSRMLKHGNQAIQIETTSLGPRIGTRKGTVTGWMGRRESVVEGTMGK